MKAVQCDVKQFLEGSKQFILPLYQRRYSWTRKHWTALLGDLQRLLHEPKRRSHFIGSFVTAPLDHAVDQNVSRYRLIDGQQRLTTLLLLLASLRDVARINGIDELADEVHGLCLSNQYKKGDAAHKLIPTAEDQSSFAALTQQPAKPDTSAIGAAYQFFFDALAALPTSQLRPAHHATLSRLSVVSITLEADDDAHLIFESLNAKGERLTQADLLRNYFLMRLPKDEADALFGELWQPMQTRLGAELTTFFRHYLMRESGGVKVRSDEVYDRVKSRVDDRAPTPADVTEQLRDIRRHSDHYARLIDPNAHEPNLRVRELVRRLHRLKSTTAYPFLLTVMDAIAVGRFEPRALPETLETIETFLVRRQVCNVPTNQLRVIFGGLCDVSANATDATSLLRGVRAALAHRQRCPTDAAFGDALIRRPIYGGSRDAARYLLERIERSFDHKESVDPSAAGVQVEHVMPQTLTDSWRGELAATAEEAEKTHGLWLHTLGNLTLSAYNAALSNSPYDAKRQRFYSTSHFSLNSYFDDIPTWNAAAIENRGRVLAERAMILWPAFAEPGEDTSTDARRRAPAEQVVAVEVFGRRYDVSSGLAAAIKAFEILRERDPAAFDSAFRDAIPANRVSITDSGQRAPRRIGPWFVDMHANTRMLKRWVVRLLRQLNLPVSTVVYHVVPPGAAEIQEQP